MHLNSRVDDMLLIKSFPFLFLWIRYILKKIHKRDFKVNKQKDQGLWELMSSCGLKKNLPSKAE